MATPVMMPRQGQSVETCIITKWHKSAGEQISKGDILFSYETDKAAFDEEAPENGILLAVFFTEGEEVPVLSNVAVIGQTGEDYLSYAPDSYSGEVAARNEEATKSTSPPGFPAIKQPDTAFDDPGFSKEGATTTDKRLKISPLARKRAREAGLDISLIKGSGPQGRIIERDIRHVVDLAKTSTVKTIGTPISGPASPVGAGKPAHERHSPAPLLQGPDFYDQKINNVRKIIAGRMTESLQTAAQLTHHISADARVLLSLRKQYKSMAGKPGQPDISINDLVCFAVVKALKLHPDVNAHFLGSSVRHFTKVHLGIAVDTERGLMVPVLKNADDLSLSGLSNSLKTLASECQTGKIDPELLASEAASFTVSNLGSFGIEMFTPVLNLPQVGILGVNTITYKPADLGEGTIGFIPAIGLSLTYDHRAIDGAPASRFLKEIKNQIENNLHKTS